MSVVTTVLLSVYHADEEVVFHSLNSALRRKSADDHGIFDRPDGFYYMNLRCLTGYPSDLDPEGIGQRPAWGGTKAPQMCLWAGAYNHLDVDWFTKIVGGLPWGYPEYVQLMLAREGDVTFAVWMFDHEGRWGEVLSAQVL